MIPLLKPGEPITEARLNQIINEVNAAHITSSDFPLERTAAGLKLKMPRRPQDFYARIVETPGRERDPGDAVKDGEYEWREAYLPGVVDGQYPPEEFENVPEGVGLRSFYDSDNDLLFDPAYELSNDRTVPVDTLVRMRVYPGVHDPRRRFIRRYVFTHVQPSPLLYAKALDDWEENGVYPEGEPRIRCRQLITNPSITPTASRPHPKMPIGEPIWIDLPRERRGGYGGVSSWLAHSTDPALYLDDLLYYSMDDQDRLICVSPYLHMGKIGEIRMFGKMPSTIMPSNEVPTGWHECDGTEQVGNAGNVTLANFARDYTALSGNADTYGAGPVHRSSSYEVGDQCFHETYDAHGSTVFTRIPFFAGDPGPPPVPPVTEMFYDTSEELAGADAHRHDIKSAQGEFPMETVYFYQRFK